VLTFELLHGHFCGTLIRMRKKKVDFPLFSNFTAYRSCIKEMIKISKVARLHDLEIYATLLLLELCIVTSPSFVSVTDCLQLSIVNHMMDCGDAGKKFELLAS